MTASDRELERDRQRVLVPAGIVVAAVLAALLGSLGVVLLVTGRFTGWPVLAIAAVVGVLAWGLWREEVGE